MERTYTLREMLGALQRRKWLGLGVAAAVLLVSAVVIAAIPSEYEAESVMQIEPHRPPSDLLPSPLTSFEDRMRTLKHGLLARPVLERVLEQTDFYPGWQRDRDAAIEKLRRKVEVRLEGELAGGPPALLFVVTVRGPSPEKVAKAAELIPRTYADMTRQVLQGQAKNLLEVLDAQLRELSGRLTAEEAKLVAFKKQHASETPEANEANLRAVATLMTLIDLRSGALAEARRRRTALLEALPEPASEAGLAGANAEDVLRRLEAARAAYGAENPDVKRIERQYREVAGRNASERKRFRAERIDAGVARADQDVRESQAALRPLQAELARVQQRLEAAPGWGEQYRALSRDYEALRAKYTSTLARASDAQASQALLAADAPSLFRTLQPAVAPSRPSAPNRGDLALIALAIALGAAFVSIAAAEYFDSSLRGPQDARAFGVPVLASIPRIGPRRVVSPR